MLVSVIIPAYRQEKTIKEDVERIYEVMSKTRFDFELIVVVDGFLDKTFEEARRVAGSNILVVGYENNRGKGYAVRYGMARARGNYIAFIDAGMEIDPNGISIMLEKMLWHDADIVVGSKRHPDSKVNYPWFRRLYSWGYHVFVNLLFRVPIKDTQVGLKLFKREVLEAVLPRLLVKRYAFDIELLAVAKYLGFSKIYESPVAMSFVFEGSGFHSFLFFDKNIRGMFLDTLAVFYRMHLLKYYHSKSQRKWVYDKELDMNVNTGELVIK